MDDSSRTYGLGLYMFCEEGESRSSYLPCFVSYSARCWDECI